MSRFQCIISGSFRTSPSLLASVDPITLDSPQVTLNRSGQQPAPQSDYANDSVEVESWASPPATQKSARSLWDEGETSS